MKTKQEYIQEVEKECNDNNILFSSHIQIEVEQEWFNLLIENLNNKNTITYDIFNSLDTIQKWYIEKHYTIHGINIIA